MYPQLHLMWLMLLLGRIGSAFGADIADASPDATLVNNACLSACIQLQVIFNEINKSIVTGIGGTSNLTDSYWAAQQGVLVPICVISPTSASDVLTILKKVEALQCKFAVRSGGHGPFAGASNIQDGITINMASINEITISADRNSVVVGTGQIWENVYSTLDAEGLAVIGAHTGDVGVGGSLLGGALSAISNLHGWGCDNVLSYEVVVGDQILNVTSTSHADLYFALRGGGGNFGIVTRFTLQAFPQGQIWAGSNTYEMAEFALLIDTMVNMTAQGTSDPKASMDLAFVYQSSINHWSAFTDLNYADAVVNPPILRNFTALPSVASTMQITNVGANSKALASGDIWGLQETFWTFSYKADPVLPHNIWVQCENNVDAFLAIHTVPGLTVACIFVPLTIPMLQQTAKNGGNAMGLTADTPLMLFLLEVTWDNASDQPAVLQFAQNFISEANATAHSMGVNHPYVHLNHAAAAQNPFFGYGEKNLKKLRAASAKYDPQGTFQKLVPGFFKL
ncbi:hypothetical protein EG329_000272 [Mollisiaceae sp. DMI_Dod_QoI]|nr:hypothetical protein EG329_000272 [Helotiales sp. DMI_Dod_QoI]